MNSSYNNKAAAPATTAPKEAAPALIFWPALDAVATVEVLTEEVAGATEEETAEEEDGAAEEETAEEETAEDEDEAAEEEAAEEEAAEEEAGETEATAAAISELNLVVYHGNLTMVLVMASKSNSLNKVV